MATTTKKKTTTTEDMLAGMITDYQGRSAYTPKTAAEIQAQAQGEYQPYYDQLRLSAKQRQQQSDLALQQQRAGLQDTFNQQREASAKDYRQRYSQADRQMLSRGMQRSSYGAQTLANINQQGAEAQQRLWDAQGAAEGNIDAQRAQLESQLGDQLRQYDASMAADVLNRTRQLSDQEYERAQAQQQRNDQLGLQLASMLRQAERDQISDAQFEQQFGLNKQQVEAQLANMAWQRGMSEREFAAQLENQAWQRQRTENQDRIAQEQWAKQFGLSQQQFEADQANKNRQFALNERQLEADLANQAWQRDMNERQFQNTLENQQWQQQRTEAQDRLAAEQWAKQFGLNERELEATLANQAWQRDLNERQFQNTLENQAWQRNYQTNRDQVADRQWQANYDYNNRKLDETLAEQLYQRQRQEARDAVSDEQWQKEYDLKARQLALSNSGTVSNSGTAGTRSSGGSGGGSSSSSSSNKDAAYENYVHELLKNKNTTSQSTSAKSGSTAEIIDQLSNPPGANPSAAANPSATTLNFTPRPVYSVESLSPFKLTPGATNPKSTTVKPGSTNQIAGPVNQAFLTKLNKAGASGDIKFESQLVNALKNKKK